MKRKAVRRIVPAVFAVLAAFLIELGAQTTGWPAAVSYGLLGFAAAALIFVGAPLAMGLTLTRDLPVNDIRGVEAEEAAFFATQLVGVVSTREVRHTVISEDRDKCPLAPNRPSVTPTGGTGDAASNEPPQYALRPGLVH